MMEALRLYALNLVIGALICGILLSMVHKGAHEALLRFLSGIFLTITLLSPLAKVDVTPELQSFRDAMKQGNSRAADGAQMANREFRQRISAELEAYILDKASQWDAELQVTVILGEDCLPVGAELSGNAGASVRQDITQMIEQELGIPKEKQRWIG